MRLLVVEDEVKMAGLLKRGLEELERAGGGTVIEAEVGDDGAAYGIEIRLDDGSVVEVNLDQSFQVIGEETDDDGAGEEPEGSEDED